MEQFLIDFQNKHPRIKVEEEVSVADVEYEDGTSGQEEVTIYNVKAIPNLDGLTLRLLDGSEFKRLDKIIDSNPVLFKDFLGGKVGVNIEVVLSRITKHQIFLYYLLRSKTIKVSIGYKSKILEVEIYLSSLQKTEIGFLADKMVGISSQQKDAIAKISGLTGSDHAELENDTRLVLRSVLFDIECSYGIAFETANLENLKPPVSQPKKPEIKLPADPISLLYKPYTAELIEYFHTAEKVDHLPFKYICYFHIIEYFTDKSAHSVVTKKIKQIMMSPDFHIKSSEYISEAIKVFKSETEKFMTDKIKISRVFSEYLNKEHVDKFIQTIGLSTHFDKEQTLKCSKDLKVNGLKFDSEQSFCESLTKRIYSIRCSIVHSNPDFDESKAVPFSPSPQNLKFLRYEIELVKEVAKTIIVNSIT